MSTLVSQCLQSGLPSPCRRLLHSSSALLSQDRFAASWSAKDGQRSQKGPSGKGKHGDGEEARFKRDELPHTGRQPVPERSRPVDLSRLNADPPRRPNSNSYGSAPPPRGRFSDQQFPPRAREAGIRTFDQRRPPPARGQSSEGRREQQFSPRAREESHSVRTFDQHRPPPPRGRSSEVRREQLFPPRARDEEIRTFDQRRPPPPRGQSSETPLRRSGSYAGRTRGATNPLGRFGASNPDSLAPYGASSGHISSSSQDRPWNKRGAQKKDYRSERPISRYSNSSRNEGQTRDAYRTERPVSPPRYSQDSRNERRPSDSYRSDPRRAEKKDYSTERPASRYSNDSRNEGQTRDVYRSERPPSRYLENSRNDRLPSDFYRSDPRRVDSRSFQRITSHLSASLDRAFSLDNDADAPISLSPAVTLNANAPTTFGDGREDRELEEGAYDAPEAADEFFHPSEPVSLVSSPTTKSKSKSESSLDTVDTSNAFTSPSLLPGFASALKEMFGPNGQPTPIQSLSIAHCLPPPSGEVAGAPGWKQFLLASETGSGKSIAYLLPLLQGIKTAEIHAQENPVADSDTQTNPQRLHNPRGLILAPTHELARQLAGFAKGLLHDVKLRVLCASRANEKSTKKKTDTTSAAQMAAQYSETPNTEGALDARRIIHPVSVVVGTPMKLLEMVRGRGWDRVEEDAKAKAEEEQMEDEELDEEGKPRIKPRRGRDKMVHFGTWRAKPELGLANVEWVVVDEADVLFDPDFQETTRTLLADISAARGHVLPASASIPVPPTLGQPTSPTTLSNPMPTAATTSSTNSSTAITPIDYPFNLILTSATIPKSLNAYLTAHHPNLVRLASPHLHRLPKSLQTEYVGWTGGNKFADVIRRIRRVWAEDAAGAQGKGNARDAELSKILVFCNRSAKVDEFSSYLEGQGVKSVAMTSRSEQRGRGSNRHLDGFLRTRSHTAAPATPTPADPKRYPHVLITTSLLSRGLDFAPDIKHVFIVDEPRNTVDFLHRAGRTGRAGEWGKVVIFGKIKGRGSARTKEVRKRIQGLRA